MLAHYISPVLTTSNKLPKIFFNLFHHAPGRISASPLSSSVAHHESLLSFCSYFQGEPLPGHYVLCASGSGVLIFVLASLFILSGGALTSPSPSSVAHHCPFLLFISCPFKPITLLLPSYNLEQKKRRIAKCYLKYLSICKN